MFSQFCQLPYKREEIETLKGWGETEKEKYSCMYIIGTKSIAAYKADDNYVSHHKKLLSPTFV